MPHGGPHNPPSRSVFAVDEFMSKLDGKGSYAKSNRFTVEIIAPTTLVSSVQASSIEFLIKTVSFPSKTFGTANYRYGGKFGLEIPYEITEEPVTIAFMGTNDWSARSFWNDWLQHIQSTDHYNMTYYKDFIGTIKISVYDETAANIESPTYQVTLNEAWPKGISTIALGWESTELVGFDVDIAYSWWTASGEASH